ncbi:hypothetical protein DUNSADRAFT_12878 [Dunaliella salina]|uniref:Uncharacterized protein n=1 Tax=Dunaliella salina TaxID=3046 RepID=A0ABQ7H3M8_DUNSA|nr:hypothetical protein DUNSADRAFT_12878 [Dunaliella salina]|eukprot:KAF5841434.1 hypothetical protein DUNSADRAFT_12878 [Dunaliella salina]
MSTSAEFFDPRKHSSVTLSVNDKLRDRGQFFSREEPLKQFTVRPSSAGRPGTAPATARSLKDPVAPHFMDDRGRWILDTHPKNLHSVTRPLSAGGDTLRSSARLTSRSVAGDEGDMSPVVALHSYNDSSPVVTSDPVVETTPRQSVQVNKSTRGPSWTGVPRGVEQQRQAQEMQREREEMQRERREMQREREEMQREREEERLRVQQRVRQEQDQSLREYEQQMMQQQQQQLLQQHQRQQEQQHMMQMKRNERSRPSSASSQRSRSSSASSSLRPGSARQPQPRPAHLTQSYPAASGSRPGSARPQSAPRANGRSSHSAAAGGAHPYTHDPGYASPKATWSPNMQSPYITSSTRYHGGSNGGGRTNRPGSARTTNSFKNSHDNYYGLPKSPSPRTIQPRGMTGRGEMMPQQEEEQGYSATGNMSGSQRSDEAYTQNGGSPLYDYNPAYDREPSANGPYASAAGNPYGPMSDDNLRAEDLQRVQDLGKGVTCNSPNAKLVGGKFKYIPRPAPGDVVYTDYYGPVGGGKDLADYYGRAYGMDTAEFAKNRLLEDFPYKRVQASMMGIQNLRDRPGLSMDSSIVHGPTKELERLEHSNSGYGLHKLNQHHRLRAKPQQFY